MAQFKHNTASKSKKEKTVFSLAEKHYQMLNEYNNAKPMIDKLKNEIDTLKRELSTSDNKSVLQQKIKTLQLEQSKIMNNDDFYKYFIANSNRLLSYYSSDKKESSLKASLLDEYMKYLKEDNYKGSIIRTSVDTCTVCSTDLNGKESCDVCGQITEQLVYCEQSSFREVIPEKPQFTYDRRHHFKELINQIQGKETTVISNAIINSIISEIKKHRIAQDTVTKADVRNMLKKLNLSKYYEHSANILNIINPANSITFTVEIEENLFYMFDAIQEPFTLFCPDKRSNLINYNYIFYKFCQILRLEEQGINYKDHFTLLKCHVKLHQHETIWKKIINYIQNTDSYSTDGIDWQYIPLNI